jgi:hypothetical protein
MRRIQVQQTIRRKGLDLDPSRSLDPRDPDLVSAKAMGPLGSPQASVLPALDREEI